MGVKMNTVSVLNGEVRAGDTIAYATRISAHTYMHIGKVLEVTEKPHAWKTLVTVPVLKVEVFKSSGWHNVPRKVTLDVLDRVVKLDAPECE